MVSWTQSGKTAYVWNRSASLPSAFPVPPHFPLPSLLSELTMAAQRWLTTGTYQTIQSAGPCFSLLPLVPFSCIGSYCMFKSPQGKPGELGQALQTVEHSSSTLCSLFLKVHCYLFPAFTLNQFLISAVSLAGEDLFTLKQLLVCDYCDLFMTEGNNITWWFSSGHCHHPCLNYT